MNKLDPITPRSAPPGAGLSAHGRRAQYIWWLAGILGLGFLTLVLVGVSRKPPSGKTIVRYCQWSGVVHQPVVYAIKEAFERENPDIEIRLEFYSRGYWQKLKTMYAAGTAPDVWYMASHDMPDFARKGQLLNLTPYIQRDQLEMSVYYEAVRRSSSWRGRTWMLGVQFGSIALYYNRDLFDEAGLAYPGMTWQEDPKGGPRRMVPSEWSWDDLLLAARVLTIDADGDGRPEQFGFHVTPNLETCVAPFVYQNGGAVMNPDRTRVVLDSPAAIEAITFLRDLRWTQKVAPTPEAGGTQGFNASQLFETGRIAMAFDGSWRMEHYNKTGTLNYDVAALPVGPQGQRGLVASGLGNIICTTSTHREAAWKWVKFYAGVRGKNDTSTPTAQRLIGTMKRGIPLLRSVAESEAFLEPDRPPQSEQVFLDQMPYARDQWPAMGRKEFHDEKLVPAVRLLLDTPPQSGPDVAEVMTKAVREANAILDRVREEQARIDAERGAK